jgi:uncharacterized membrane protein
VNSVNPRDLSPALERNIEALSRRRAREQKASWGERVAQALTRFTGRMLFVYLHLAFFGFWIIANLRWIPVIPSWDESFMVLATVASVEAIFLSIFVLITQNRMAAAADQRADLNLQIGLLCEHEITKLATVIGAIAKKLDVHTGLDAEFEAMTKDVAPEAVLDKIADSELLPVPKTPS